MMKIKEFLERDPYRDIEGVIKITEHDPRKVWTEMDEYVPTEKVKDALREILDTLLETKRGSNERVCVWVSGFFGSGKSHFLKVLGYLLEDRELKDAGGNQYSSQEFLCRKLGFTNYLPNLQREFTIKVLFINLLDDDPQSPERPTISRLIYRSLLETQGFSTVFWIAAWEKELKQLGKWDEFLNWVQQRFRRSWEEERRLNADVVLKQALPNLLPDRYRSEDEANQAIQESKRTHDRIEPSSVVKALKEFAQSLHKEKGRIVVLLDEVGLYIGDSVERLTDLNRLTEKIVEDGEGKILLIASAQEALRELVPRLAANSQILNWLQDRFRTKFHLEPTEVQHVVAERLLKKNPKGSEEVSQLFQRKMGTLRSALTIDSSWNESDFVSQYPCHPYSVRLIQNIMGAFHSSVEEARRLSVGARSVLQLVHGILRGEGEIICGAEQPIGWLIPLDLFYDGLRGSLRSDQVSAMGEIAKLGDVNGLPVSRVAKALFLLQQVSNRYPCDVDNIASALVDSVDVDINSLKDKVKDALQKLREAGWVSEDKGKFRLLTPEQHFLEQEVNRNYPTPSEMKNEMNELLKGLLRDFRYEHGSIRKQLPVGIVVDKTTVREPELYRDERGNEREGLKVVLFTPFDDTTENEVLAQSITDTNAVFWKAGDNAELKQVLGRSIALRKTLEQWKTRNFSEEQNRYREQIERESVQLRQVRLPQLIQDAFMRGQIFVRGQKIGPSGKDLQSNLRDQIREIAEQLYTQFVDKRPAKDDDCAAILDWQPGSPLPQIYSDLEFLTSDQQIRRDNQYLSAVRSEIQRRQRMGLESNGKAIVEHFEKPPFGWDSRLIRLLVATLMKAGWLSVRYQNRTITDPTDAQLRSVFSKATEFHRATFEILEEVDWRKASSLCSQVFGVAGGDTFERTANIVGEQAQNWQQKIAQLAIRCQDNGLPSQIEQTCNRASDLLKRISQTVDLNSRLRRFLEFSDELSEMLPKLRSLEKFDFDAYRRCKAFVQFTREWAQNLEREGAERWHRLAEGVNAADLLDRFQSLQNDFAALLSRYRNEYIARHGEFQSAVNRAIEELLKHPAFQDKPSEAENILKPLAQWLCESDGTPSEEDFRCPKCRRSFDGMAFEKVHSKQEELIAQLDELMPKPVETEKIEPLQIEQIVQSESEIKSITDKIRLYLKRAGGRVKVQIQVSKVE